MNVTELKRYRMKPNAVVGDLPWWTESGEYLGRELPNDVRTVELWEPHGVGSVEVLRCSVQELEGASVRPTGRRQGGLMVAGLALLALLLPNAAHAEVAGTPRCRTASFETCAATGRSAGIVAIGRGDGDLAPVGARIPRDWSMNSEGTRLDEWISPDCSAPHHAHLNCPAPPISVTPEPVTMTLLATGLAGMSAAGLRRRKPKVE